MTQTQFSLSWNSFKDNLCDGLSSLQQHEDFVDMTLAADGHFVKVHKIVLCLSSPYLKELITSAPCPHPVLFLNHVSYQTLCSLLEYIYSGEVLVNKENINELLQAGRVLHIRGLEVMGVQSLSDKLPQNKAANSKNVAGSYKTIQVENTQSSTDNIQQMNESFNTDNIEDNPSNTEDVEECYIEDHNYDASLEGNNGFDSGTQQELNPVPGRSASLSSRPTIQYTLSNQGNIQMILNRYIYFLRYNYRKGKPVIRLWRCVDYIRNKCPASVTTKNDIVVQRVAAHKHPFHDKKIVKKLQTGFVFNAIQDAERTGNQMINRKDACVIYRAEDSEAA